MNKTQGYFIAIAIVVTLAYLMYGPSAMDPHAPSFKPDFIPNLTSKINSTAPDEAAPVAPPPALTPQEQESARVKSFIRKLPLPTVESAREEIAKDPHATPKVLVKSAVELNHIFKSINDESSAKVFLDKMRDCSSETSDTPVAMKSTCVRFLDRLQKKFPQLKSDIESARAQASEEARELEKVSR